MGEEMLKQIEIVIGFIILLGIANMFMQLRNIQNLALGHTQVLRLQQNIINGLLEKVYKDDKYALPAKELNHDKGSTGESAKLRSKKRKSTHAESGGRTLC